MRSKPTETKAYGIKVYTNVNAGALTTQKKRDIAQLYTDRYSSPKWNIPPEELRLDTLFNEMDMATSTKGGMIITIEDEGGKVIGFRLCVGFSSVVDSAEKDDGLKHTIEAMRRAVDYDIREASYTVDTCVSRDHEGKGLGHRMMQVQIDTARQTGIPAIIGWTLDSNDRMIRLYEAAGYAPINGLEGVTTGSDYNIRYGREEGEPPFRSEQYAPLTYRHLLLNKPAPAGIGLRK